MPIHASMCGGQSGHTHRGLLGFTDELQRGLLHPPPVASRLLCVCVCVGGRKGVLFPTPSSSLVCCAVLCGAVFPCFVVVGSPSLFFAFFLVGGGLWACMTGVLCCVDLTLTLCVHTVVPCCFFALLLLACLYSSHRPMSALRRIIERRASVRVLFFLPLSMYLFLYLYLLLLLLLLLLLPSSSPVVVAIPAFQLVSFCVLCRCC